MGRDSMILSQVFGSDSAWVVGQCKRACDWGCARSVWKTDLRVPPNWISGGAANRLFFLGATRSAALRAVTASGSVSWLEQCRVRFLGCRMRAGCAHVFPETSPDKPSSLQRCGGARVMISGSSVFFPRSYVAVYSSCRPERGSDDYGRRVIQGLAPPGYILSPAFGGLAFDDIKSRDNGMLIRRFWSGLGPERPDTPTSTSCGFPKVRVSAFSPADVRQHKVS